MKSATLLLGCLFGAVLCEAAQDEMSLITFPGITWIENNDPIVPNNPIDPSHGNWSVVDDYAIFQGTVMDVPLLRAPGFCRAVTVALFFKDASAFVDGGLKLTVRTTTPDYKGFRIAFGTPLAPKHHGGHELQGSYKTGFNVPASVSNTIPDVWQTVFIPFDSFSYDWSDYTGDCSTKDPDGYQHKCCSKDNSDVCPTASRLKGINSFNIWAEGAEGDFHLEIKEIAAASSPKDSSAILV